MSDKRLTTKDLSPDQREVYDGMTDWVNGRHPTSILTVGGYAGTGKTSVLGVFAKAMQKEGKLVAYVAYTGRAASILKGKLLAAGVETTSQLRRTSDDSHKAWTGYFSNDLDENDGPPLCGTIHKLLYRPVIDPKTEELRRWVKRDTLDREYDLIVVDEASMVSDDILRDIQGHLAPLLAVGDHGQLPPVMASGELMKHPDLRLDKIHRQAEGNPIITLSALIREGGSLVDFKGWGDSAEEGVTLTSKKVTQYQIEEAFNLAERRLDVGLLCWTNRTRVKLNASARVALGLRGVPRKDEVIICLKNKPPVFNGMRGLLTQDAVLAPEGNAALWLLGAQIEFPDEGLPPEDVLLCAPQFNREKAFESVEELRERGMDIYSMTAAGYFYDFGYALTVHKAQGSQFDHVVLFVDRPEKPWEEDYRRWAYTAVTRASKRLTVLR